MTSKHLNSVVNAFIWKTSRSYGTMVISVFFHGDSLSLWYFYLRKLSLFLFVEVSSASTCILYHNNLNSSGASSHVRSFTSSSKYRQNEEKNDLIFEIDRHYFQRPDVSARKVKKYKISWHPRVFLRIYRF